MVKLSQCLADLGITDASTFDNCDNVEDEIKVIKKIYFKLVLIQHPDKGGDAALFRTTQAAWETLHELYGKGVKGGTFASYFVSARNARGNARENAARRKSAEDEADDDDYAPDPADDYFDDELYKKYANNTSTQSYEYYEAAAEEDVPGYRVELAKSGRSKCSKSKELIDKGEVRVGSLDSTAGTYGRWHKLDQWRVPVKFQNGLTNPSDEQISLRDLLAMEDVLFVGISTLDDASQMAFVRHCIDQNNWAYQGKKRKVVDNAIMGGEGPTINSSSAASSSMSASAMVASTVSSSSSSSVPGMSGSFRVLVPGMDGARGNDALSEQSFVITGTFPEAGGVDAGVGNVKAMIESFGGSVITRFSKKTTHLLVGMDAVAGKFKDATKRSAVIVNLQRLQGLLLNHYSLEQMNALPTLTPTEFQSTAYQAAGAPLPINPAARSASAASMAAAGSAMAAAGSAMAAAASAMAAAASAVPSKMDPPPSSNAIVPAIPTINESTDVVPRAAKKVKFTIPRPGVDGGVAGVLNGKRFVLTGVFPEVGGGTGLSLGKDRVTSMIESFGGVVTSAVSGKTNFLLVGAEPGRSKVSKADEKGIPLIDLIALNRLLLGRATIEATASAPPPRIDSFSAGYAGQFRLGY